MELGSVIAIIFSALNIGIQIGKTIYGKDDVYEDELDDEESHDW